MYILVTVVDVVLCFEEAVKRHKPDEETEKPKM